MSEIDTIVQPQSISFLHSINEGLSLSPRTLALYPSGTSTPRNNLVTRNLSRPKTPRTTPRGTIITNSPAKTPRNKLTSTPRSNGGRESYGRNGSGGRDSFGSTGSTGSGKPKISRTQTYKNFADELMVNSSPRPNVSPRSVSASVTPTTTRIRTSKVEKERDIDKEKDRDRDRDKDREKDKLEISNQFDVGGIVHFLSNRAQYRDIISIADKLIILLLTVNVGPSRRMLTVFTEVAKGYPSVIFASINVNQQSRLDIPELEYVYAPRCPILRFFMNGAKIRETSGPYISRLRDGIKNALEYGNSGNQLKINSVVVKKKTYTKLKRGNTHEPAKKSDKRLSKDIKTRRSYQPTSSELSTTLQNESLSPPKVRKNRSKSYEDIDHSISRKLT